MTSRYPWEGEAQNWTQWARTPGHDVFPYFAPAFLHEIVPVASGLTLEVGCGEGRVVRELTARGHDVVGLDSSRTLARHAQDLDDRSAYLAGDATALPFTDATFQTVVAYNSLQTMSLEGDMADAVREAARVLKPSGHLCVCVAHPFTDLALVKELSTDAEGAIPGSYFERNRVNETVQRDGLTMTFNGWTYTLEDYARALEDAGFVVELVREPTPRVEHASQRSSLERWRRVPLFLLIRAICVR